MRARTEREEPGWRLRAFARAQSLLQAMADFGTTPYPAPVRRRLKILNVVCYLIAFFTAAYAVQHLFVDRHTWAPVIVINLALAVVALTVPFLHRFNELAGGLTIACAELVALFVLTAYVGRSSGIHIQYVAYAATPFVVLGLGQIWLIALLVIAALALHIAAWFLFDDGHALIQASAFDLHALYVTAAITTFGVVAAAVYYAFHLAERAEADMDALLRNVLPYSIVDRLKEKPGATIADTFEEASVLFADLKGFVPFAQYLGAAATVEFLNRLMTRFDQLAERHRVEKIKTIGDAYMVACGIPTRDPDHALRLAGMGLDMLDVVKTMSVEAGMPLAMRIGMSSGPVMAGVIGAKRLTYDVWGDTVNLAARLENQAEPGRFHVCNRARELLECAYVLERRDPLELKGFGIEQTWYLVSPRTTSRAPSARTARDLTPSRP